MPENSITITFQCTKKALGKTTKPLQRMRRNAGASGHLPDIAKGAVALQSGGKKSEKRLLPMTLLRAGSKKRTAKSLSTVAPTTT
jgi:hypothetical protein